MNICTEHDMFVAGSLKLFVIKFGELHITLISDMINNGSIKTLFYYSKHFVSLVFILSLTK